MSTAAYQVLSTYLAFKRAGGNPITSLKLLREKHDSYRGALTRGVTLSLPCNDLAKLSVAQLNVAAKNVRFNRDPAKERLRKQRYAASAKPSQVLPAIVQAAAGTSEPAVPSSAFVNPFHVSRVTLDGNILQGTVLFSPPNSRCPDRMLMKSKYVSGGKVNRLPHAVTVQYEWCPPGSRLDADHHCVFGAALPVTVLSTPRDGVPWENETHYLAPAGVIRKGPQTVFNFLVAVLNFYKTGGKAGYLNGACLYNTPSDPCVACAVGCMLPYGMPCGVSMTVARVLLADPAQPNAVILQKTMQQWGPVLALLPDIQRAHDTGFNGGEVPAGPVLVRHMLSRLISARSPVQAALTQAEQEFLKNFVGGL